MIIKPTPKRTFIFTQAEFTSMEMQRFRDEVAELRALPNGEKNKLMGRCIIYPKVLTGTMNYTQILSDGRMREFIKAVSSIFPEWLFYFHATNQFSPVQLYGQLDSLTIIEGPASVRSRIVSSRAHVMLTLLDAYAAARVVADECGTRQETFMKQVRKAFAVANFELSVLDDRLIPDQRKGRCIIVISEADFENGGLEKVKAIFGKADPKRDRGAFAFEVLPEIEDERSLLFYDGITRFLRRVWLEIPESIFFLRANTPGALSVISCALELRELRSDPDDLQWHCTASADDVLQAVLRNYATLRRLDAQAGILPEETVSHLETVFGGFGLRFCPTRKQ